jgi:hypothetical protein
VYFQAKTNNLGYKHTDGGEKTMREMIAYCGLRCDECNILKVTQAKDYEQKKQIAKRWSDQFNIKFKPEDIDCEGCKSNVLSGWCRNICKMRSCAEARKVETCAHCDDYPCEKLKEFLSEEPVAKENLEKIRKTL